MDEPKIITLDLRGCRNLDDMHWRIKIAFDFPDYYGENWNAFWDLIDGTREDVYKRQAYHNEELKSLTRYRFDKVKERAKLKSSVSRLVCILFPELEKLVPTLHMASEMCIRDRTIA